MAGDHDKVGKSAKWDIPPWELPGGFRLDSKPHRGPLLRRLANIGFVCSLLSFYPFGCFLFICIVESWIKVLAAAVVLGLLGSGFGLVVWMLARGDLQDMRTGLTNPDGKWETQFGRDRAILSFVLGFFSFLLWGTGVLLAWLQN
jgi:hypothetical protein